VQSCEVEFLQAWVNVNVIDDSWDIAERGSDGQFVRPTAQVGFMRVHPSNQGLGFGGQVSAVTTPRRYKCKKTETIPKRVFWCLGI
jgi:hypothetical protein